MPVVRTQAEHNVLGGKPWGRLDLPSYHPPHCDTGLAQLSSRAASTHRLRSYHEPLYTNQKSCPQMTSSLAGFV